MNTALFKQLLLNDIPLLDVRAPCEFLQGAFPAAVNIPLLDDSQREKVGTVYKQQGKDAAIRLGHELISGEEKEHRLRHWKQFIKDNPNAHIYCFRGGLRSKTSQQWIKDNGIDIPLIPGGYKALRRYLIEQLERLIEQQHFIILGGKTGTGKTHLLNLFEHSIDLEGLANHRGSSFGRYVKAQPSQIDFENALAIQLLKHEDRRAKEPIILEDEAFLIGRISLPKALHEKMKKMPLVLLEQSLEQRVEVILGDYIISNYQDFKLAGNELGFDNYLLSSLERIKKRLGGERYQQVKEIMQAALNAQKENDDMSLHRQWIHFLMEHYYDPMYSYQLDKKQHRVVFRGDYEQVKAWFASAKSNEVANLSF